MDNGRFMYSRPVVVTEDRIKEALEKQAKQKALKAALDRQVREAERLKSDAHRAKGRQGKQRGDLKVNFPLTSASANEKSNAQTASPAVTASVAGPSPPTVSTTVTPGTVESTRYTFSCHEGQGTFKVEGSSARRLQSTLPPSSESRERIGGATPPNTGGEAGKALARARRQPGTSEVDSGSDRHNSRGGRPVPAANGGEYQTNSLPINFTAKGTTGKMAVSPESRGGSNARGHRKNTGNDGYDTQSLPVELVYKVGQASNNTAVAKPPLRRITTPLRSSSSGHVSAPGRHQSPLGPLTGAVPGNPKAAARENFTSPPNDRTRSPDWAGAGGGRPLLSSRICGKGAPRVLGSGGGTPEEKVMGARYVSPRPLARLAGGILPPLNTHNDSDVIEMSAVLDAATPTREYSVMGAATGAPSGPMDGSSAQPSSHRRTSSTPAERLARPSQPPSPPDAVATEQAYKQAEREKAWAQQVKQIKAELRKTRAKGPGKGGLKSGVRGAISGTPRRAETAPDPQPHPPMRGGLGGAAGGGASGAHGLYGVGAGTKGNFDGGRPHQVEKMDFAKVHIFTRENFRPITAPEDAVSYFGMLSPPSLPALAQVPKAKLREQAWSTIESLTEAEGKEETMGTEVGSSPSMNAIHTYTSTVTSGEESLKLASLTTRQVTLGLPDYGNSDPVPIQFNHILQFVEAQMITMSQAESLWDFFASSSEVVRQGGSGSSAEHARSSLSTHSTRDVWGRAARGGVNDFVASMKSSTLELEVVEKKTARNGAGATTGDKDNDNNDGRSPFVRHSPSQLPTSAVLAPALRRKISQQHSEHEAALLHKPHKPLQSSRPRLSPSGSVGRGENGSSGGVVGGPTTSPHYARVLQNRFGTAAETRDKGGDEDEGGAGTFDTFSNLILPADLNDD
ncbi:hypothetical protein MNV84_06022 [Leishmania braziliensis]|nr:hypothetical protein MNV84_06022 [Leishmania braziliensis]